MSASAVRARTRHAVAILGAGRFAEAVTRLVAARAAEVRVWARRPAAAGALASRAALPHVRAVPSLADAVLGARVVVFAVPAPALPEVAAAFGAHARGDQLVLHGARGVAPTHAGAGTSGAALALPLPHRVLRAESCVRFIAALGGPLYVDALTPAGCAPRPIVAVLATRFDAVARAIAELCEDTPIRLHATHDVAGVELIGALSNVAALAAGLADGLALGEAAHGILRARGLTEAAALGARLGAEPSTFTGLAGLGDLVPRPVASTERHLRVGARLAAGERLAALVAAPDAVPGSSSAPPASPPCVEGLVTAPLVAAHAARLGLSLPMTAAVAAILEGADAEAELGRVLALDWSFPADPPASACS